MRYVWEAVLVLFVAIAPAFGQSQKADHQSPEDAFGTRELVAWSTLQEPQPVRQPLLPADDRGNQGAHPQQRNGTVEACDPQSQVSRTEVQFSTKREFEIVAAGSGSNGVHDSPECR
jgi:hypothetical protein